MLFNNRQEYRIVMQEFLVGYIATFDTWSDQNAVDHAFSDKSILTLS